MAFPAKLAKQIVYKMNVYLNAEMTCTDFMKYSERDVVHEMMHTWLHMYFPIQTELIKHYPIKANNVGPYTERMTKGQRTTIFLSKKTQFERWVNSGHSHTWDVKSMNLLMENKHGESHLRALDAWLTALHDNVVLIQWWADWGNELSFWQDTHGPFHALLQDHGGKLPAYRLLKSHSVLNLPLHFNQGMMLALARLTDSDLEILIKIQWFHNCTELAHISSTYPRLQYHKECHSHSFLRTRDEFVVALNERSQLEWLSTHADCPYNLMPTNPIQFSEHIASDNVYTIETKHSLMLQSQPTLVWASSSAGGMMSLVPIFTTSVKFKAKMEKKNAAKKDKNKSKKKLGGGGGGTAGHGGMHSIQISSAEERRRKQLADDAANKLPKTNKRTIIRHADGSFSFTYPANYQNDNDSDFNSSESSNSDAYHLSDIDCTLC